MKNWIADAKMTHYYCSKNRVKALMKRTTIGLTAQRICRWLFHFLLHFGANMGNRQTTLRMDRHETIVTGRCETFRYCHIGGIGMTSAELKHRAKLQEWAARIQDCRSSGLSVRAWCRQERINATTYYRWEREFLALAETEPCSSVSAVRFAELSAPKQVSRNVAERSAMLHIGNASLDIYPGCDAEQLRLLVELLRLC